MLLSILIGAAIGYAVGTVIAEIFFTIYERWNARTRIEEKAKESNPNIIKLFVESSEQYVDEDAYVLKAYDKSNNHIANINVTAPSGTRIRVGETLYT